MGIVSYIDESRYVVRACRSNDSPIPEGTEFELQDTYCSDVVRERRTKFYKNVAEISEMLKHPCYINTQLRAYIGTPIYMGGKVWGTLNFSSMSPSKLDYSEEEVKYLESQARVVGKILSTDE
jgi:GAF domain-containing protein